VATLLAPADRLLDDLDPEQREAVLATSGPVAILAGAGTGKTRVISRRTAYAIASGVVPADQVLVVTFTDKAAGEMVERLRSLGLRGVTARTFHAHALSQLRHFWPSRHDGQAIPQLLDSKALILGRLARGLPGHYRFTPTKDLADEIEWAKARRVVPRTYLEEAGRVRREPPIPGDLFVRIFGDYERANRRRVVCGGSTGSTGSAARSHGGGRGHVDHVPVAGAVGGSSAGLRHRSRDRGRRS